MSATITSKGQVTVPKAIRDMLGLEPGDKVDFVPTEDSRVEVRRIKRTTLADLIGCVPYDGPPLTPEEMDDAIGDHVAEKHERIKREAGK